MSHLSPPDLRARYRAERDKRIRAEGNEQYLQPTGRFASLLDDPYVEVQPRAAVERDVDALVIGAGFSGLVTGARLRQAGVADIVLVDKAGDVGGVWYWNRYPGAMCDTAAMIYLPLLEETGTVPSRKYVNGPEIYAHAQRIARTFDLYRDALLSTGIESVRWDEPTHRWHVHTDRGDVLRARFVTMGTGPLHRPKLPGIEGIERFTGHSFHTSRWDYDYTGGSPAGEPMDRLADKRVGIIGTGATAVQCIPHLAVAAKELFVFQRTPSSIDVRGNHDIDPDWFSELKPGWQKEWLVNFATLQMGGFADVDLVKDGWTDIAQRIRDKAVAAVQGGAEFSAETLLKAYEDSDDEKMNEIRDRVDSIVADSTTAEALKPWYRQLCKRPCFHDEYLQSYNQPSAHLVDTDGQGVRLIDETGVWVGDTHYELDCLVFASGFEVGTDYARRSGFDVVGRNGTTLSDHWREGMRSLHGIHVAGFPNLFVLGIAQGGALISNIPHNFVEAAEAIAAVINEVDARGAQVAEVTAEAEDAWVTQLQSRIGGIFGNPDCTPGYYNNEGHPMGRKEQLDTAGYPAGPVAFFDYLARWRNSGEFVGLEFS